MIKEATREANLPFKAYRVVADVLKEGAKTHAQGAWMEMPISEHMAHAEGHVEEASLDIEWNGVAKDYRNPRTDIQNAICRLVMILDIMDEEAANKE